MDDAAIGRYIVENHSNVQTSENFGYKFFFYGDDHRMPFATLAASDNEYDSVSNLDRAGVYRLNIGISKQRFQALFGTSEVVLADYDFTVLDRVMPHPDYFKQFFVCILNPGEGNLPVVKEMLADAHGISETRYNRRSQD